MKQVKEQHQNDRVASPESIPAHLNVVQICHMTSRSLFSINGSKQNLGGGRKTMKT